MKSGHKKLDAALASTRAGRGRVVSIEELDLLKRILSAEIKFFECIKSACLVEGLDEHAATLVAARASLTILPVIADIDPSHAGDFAREVLCRHTRRARRTRRTAKKSRA